MTLYHLLDTLPNMTERIAGTDLALLFVDGNRCFIIGELGPGTRCAPHYHRYGSEVVYILGGRGKLITRHLGQVKISPLQEGDLIRMDADIVHQLFNDSRKPLRLLLTCRPSHLALDNIEITDLARDLERVHCASAEP